MILYNLRKAETGFLIAKFDEDFNVEAVYEVSDDGHLCSCPAGPRPSCKHRKMLPRMIDKADTDEFYCYETQRWHKPLAPAGVEEPIETLDQVYEEHEPTGVAPQVEPLPLEEPMITQAEVRTEPKTPKEVFNPTAGIPKTSFGPKDSPSYDNATWFSTVQPPKPSAAEALETIRPKQDEPGRIRRRV